MISHLQSMFGILGCFTVLTQHICNKSKFRHITSSVMCAKLAPLMLQCMIWQDNCDSDQTGQWPRLAFLWWNSDKGNDSFASISPWCYSDKGITWLQLLEIHLAGTGACVALKSKIEKKKNCRFSLKIFIRVIIFFFFLIYLTSDKKGKNADFFPKYLSRESKEKVRPVGVGGAMISVQIFRVISCSGANSCKSHGISSLKQKTESIFHSLSQTLWRKNIFTCFYLFIY